MALEPDELVAALEAVIFVSSEPVTMKLLSDVFPEETEESLTAGLERLAKLFEQPGRGLLLDRVAGGWRIATRPDVHQHVGRVVQREKAERLSVKTLETLSVIAYKQPVTAAEIGEIRGVDVSGTIRTLLERDLIKVAGRKRVVGRPFVYGTSKKFLAAFGLNDLSELPTLKELEDLVTDVPTTDPAEVDPEDVPVDGEQPGLGGLDDGASLDAAAGQEPAAEAAAAEATASADVPAEEPAPADEPAPETSRRKGRGRRAAPPPAETDP